MDQLITDLKTIQQRTVAEEDENIRFRQFLKYRLKWSDRKLDKVMHEIAREVAAGVDCTQCGNCCRGLEISLDEEDLARLATNLDMTVGQVEARYTKTGKFCDCTFTENPCAFLRENRCSVYAARPRDCREYPHLDKSDLRARMWQLLTNAGDCPIVFNTLQRIKRVIRDDAW